MGKVIEIIWTHSAKNQLKTIYNYYKEKSGEGAKNVKNDIFTTVKSIVFTEQYQKDELEPEYRKIIVRNYKILYKEENDIVYIVKIFSMKRDPYRQI